MQLYGSSGKCKLWQLILKCREISWKGVSTCVLAAIIQRFGPHFAICLYLCSLWNKFGLWVNQLSLRPSVIGYLDKNTKAGITSGLAALRFSGGIHPFQPGEGVSNLSGLAFKLFLLQTPTIGAMFMRCAGCIETRIYSRFLIDLNVSTSLNEQ